MGNQGCLEGGCSLGLLLTCCSTTLACSEGSPCSSLLLEGSHEHQSSQQRPLTLCNLLLVAASWRLQAS